jgi:hypothetical protein
MHKEVKGGLITTAPPPETIEAFFAKLRVDEIADWCLLESLRRDAQLVKNLQKLKFQRHAIDRVVYFARNSDWASLKDADYDLLLERYVPWRKMQFASGNVQFVWDYDCECNTLFAHDVKAARAIAHFMLEKKNLKAYREFIRNAGS